MTIQVPRAILARLVPLFVVGSVVLLTGCLVTSNTEEKRSGNYVSDSTFDQIRPHETTAAWVQATLGNPTSVEKLEDGAEIWRYSYSVRKESSGGVFLIFGGHSTDEVQRTAFVQIKDGVVARAWRT